MRYMTKSILSAVFLTLFSVSALWAHCEIPCGIYNDQLRIQLILEDITTIEKSMNMITKLGGENPVNYNQLVRWIDNKEEHANKIQHIVTQYFLTQRIKSPKEETAAAMAEYQTRLTLLHKMLVQAMKCKQTTDLAHTQNLRDLVEKFQSAYFSKEDLKHLQEHKSDKN